MSKNDFVENMSTQQFSFFIFFLLVFLILIIAFAFLTNTIWTIGLALLVALPMPLFIYIDVHVERKRFTQAVIGFFFIVIFNYVLLQYGPLWTPYPFFTLALFQCLFAWFFIGLISNLLCERFLKPRLKSKLVKKVDQHTLRPLHDK